MEFKVGDKVEWMGVIGTVVITPGYNRNSNVIYPLEVDFNVNGVRLFTRDGKLESFHKEPSLKLVERPKKKVKKTIERWANIYSSYIISNYDSEKHANKCAEDRIACVKLTGTYEVEE